MKVTAKLLVGWPEALNAARTTVHKRPLDKEPSSEFINESLISEHSHIREVVYSVLIEGVQSWVATHLVRHHIGVEKYVATQRTDRTGVPRADLPQGALVDMRITLNAQALLSISRRRLCHAASKETRATWQRVVSAIARVDKDAAWWCVPQCVHCGYCPERKATREACGLNWQPWRGVYLGEIAKHNVGGVE